MAAEIVVTGMGVVSAVGQGKEPFINGLLQAEPKFCVMQRPGRQNATSFVGAEITDLILPKSLANPRLRTASLSAQFALLVVEEAWVEARLSDVDPTRIGLIIGGTNTQQREQTLIHDKFRERLSYLRPTYGLSFMDSDLCGFCTAQFGIRGLSHTVGGASASGQLAIIQSAVALLAKQVDVCIAVGALMDLSYWECQGLSALGAMAPEYHADEPFRAYCPFDRDRKGFVFGECSGAIVLETEESSRRRGATPRAVLSGWGTAMDANRNPDPSFEGEVRAINAALDSAGWSAANVDYVNPHGTGSIIGDEVELQALKKCELSNAYINATKSLTGHGLTAAGTVEVVATLLQMQAGQLHPTRNLENPIDSDFNWVRQRPETHRTQKALTLSMGFGGINTALCWQRCLDS